MTSEVKLMSLQKQVEDLKRKLRDSTHEKVQAINRSNQDWERKLVSQTAISLKRLQAEHDLKMTSLQSDIGLHVGREVATATSEKDSQIRRIKETIDNEKGSAVRVACFKTEDKYSEIIKQIESEWKTRETSLTREIFHLSGEREEIANQLAVLKQSDFEKAAIIKSLNFDHEKVVKELIDVSKQDQYKEYTKFKSLEKYAQDKESEVKRLEGKVDLLKVDKEILEKQLQTIKKLYSSPDSSPTVPRIIRYSEREREQNKRIRDLEEKLRLSLRNRGSSTMSNYSIESSPVPNIHSPTGSVSPDSFDSIKQLRRQNRELREQLKISQQIYLETEKQIVPKESEYLQKEVDIKEKNNYEITVISPLTEIEHSDSKLDTRIENTDIHEQHYKQLYRESIQTQQAYSLWCEGNSGTAEFEELKAENNSLQIHCDSLKNEYTAILLQNNKLIHDRDQVLADKNTVENKYEILQSTMDRKELRIEELENIEFEISNLRESNETLISQQEGFTLLIDKQIQEIDLLKPYESEMNEFQTFQESFEIMQEKLIQAQSKEKELMTIIQTLEDQNSYLQSEVQSKDDKLSDLTTVISNLTERLTKQRSAVTMDTNGTGRNGNHTGSEIMFYPQMGFVNKNNNNNNNNDADDELEFETIETAYKSPSKQVQLNEQNIFTSKPAQLNEQNIFNPQLSPSKQAQLNEENISPSKQVQLNEQNIFTSKQAQMNQQNISSSKQAQLNEENISASKQAQLNEENLFAQLLEEAYNSETTLSTDSDELPPISLQEADSQTQFTPTDDVSIDEWSHASEDNNGQTPDSPKVSPIPTPDNTPLKRTPDLFLVRYNYDPLVSSPNPHPEQELPLTAGNCIYIYGTPDEDGFYIGELTDGITGLVPSNFVERIKLDSSSGETEIKDTIVPQTDSSSLAELGTMGPLDLYIQTQTDPNSLVHGYNSNLSNIVEEDESLLDYSNLTRISGNISSSDSISKSQTENNSSNESLDKITDIQTPIPSPLHIPVTRDIRVKYTESDVELTWTVPQQISDTILGYHISIGTEITHFIEGSSNTKLSLSTLQDKLTPGKYTLVVCTVTNHGYSDPTECTVDTTIIPAPTNLTITRDESTVLISWSSPDTNTLTSPLVSFEVYLNEVILAVVDFSDFLVNKGVSIPRTKLLEFYESSPDQHMNITIRSLLSNGRISPLSEPLPIPLIMLTRTDSISGAMTNLDTESSEECSKHSTSSESEFLEVFRKSSLETDQLFKAKRNISLEFSEVTNKPPINHRATLAQSTGSSQRQSFTPNEYDLFSELEAQGESDLTPEMFSVQQTQSGSDSDDETHSDFPTDTTVSYYVALYDYNPTNQSPETGDDKNELPLKKGEVLAIFGIADEYGFFTGQVDSQVGLVPYNLVEKIKICEISGETSSALLFQATKQAFPARNFKALYSYNPNTDSPNCEDLDDELSFHSGTSISIYGDVHDDGFFIGERDGEMGYVPSNFIEAIDIVKTHTEQQMAESPKGATPVESHKPNKNILSKTKGILRSLSKKS